MNESDLPDLRIGDTEREQALAALGEHMSSGRLDIDEYGDRSARVTAVRTRSDLVALFADLPEPKPAFGAPALAVQPGPERPGPAQRSGWRGIPREVTGPMIGVVWASAIFIGPALGANWLFGAGDRSGVRVGSRCLESHQPIWPPGAGGIRCGCAADGNSGLEIASCGNLRARHHPLPPISRTVTTGPRPPRPADFAVASSSPRTRAVAAIR